jgi:AmiR/NasT family two-component response regulator
MIGEGRCLAAVAGGSRQLTDALENRDALGLAKGILLAQGAVDDQASSGLLITTSQHTNTKLHCVALQLVDAVTSNNADHPEP